VNSRSDSKEINLDDSKAFKTLTILLAVAGSIFWAPFADAMNLPKITFVLLFVVPYVLFQIGNYPSVKRTKRSLNLFHIVMLLLSVTILVSSIMSPNIFGSLLGHHSRYNGAFLYLVLILIVYFVQRISFEGISQIFIKYFAYASLIQVGYATLQFLNVDPIVWNLEFNRIVSTLGNPDFSSAYIGMSGIAYLHLAISTQKAHWKRLFWASISALCLLLTVATSAKQGTAIMIFGCLVYLFFSEALENKRLAIVSATTIVTGAFMVIIGMFRFGPLESIVYKDSISFRGDYWRAGLRMFYDNPVFGVGFARYGDFFREYRDLKQVSRRGAALTSDQSHNVYLDFFATGGILVGLLYITLVGLVTFFGIRNILASKNKQIRRVHAALFAIWAAYLAQAFISIDQITLAIWGWLVAAVIAASYAIDRREKVLDLREVSTPKSRKYLLGGIPIYLLGIVTLLLPIMRADSPLRDVNALMNRVNESPELRDYVNLRASQVVEENTRDSYALKQSGIALAMVGEIDKSISALERAIQSNPRDSVSNAALGSILRQTGKVKESIVFFDKAISLDPLNEGIYAELIQSQLSLGDPEDARGTLSKMSRIDSKSKLYLESLSLINSFQSGR
jgi:O-antigen ligase